jgi:hypothetical protein
VVSQGQARLDASLERALAQLFQSRSGPLRECLGGEVRQRIAAPQRERFVEGCKRANRVVGIERVAGAGAQALEPAQVERLGLDVEHVARRTGLDDRPGGLLLMFTERAPQFGDLAVDLRDRAHRRVAWVELLGDAIDRDDAARVEQQQGQHGALVPPAERDLGAVATRLERAEDAELDHPGGTVAGR